MSPRASSKQPRAPGRRPGAKSLVAPTPPEAAPAPALARVFWSGRSQAVRLPKAFRLRTSVVRISAEGERIVLEEDVDRDANGWPVGFRSLFGAVGEDLDLGDRRRPAERPDPLGD